MPLADRAIGNLQQWLIGTYHGVSRDQLQVYLDEFVFRHNRRRLPMAAFQTLLGLGAGHKPTAYKQIRVPPIFPSARRRLTPSYWGLLKQPDKQKRIRAPLMRLAGVPVAILALKREQCFQVPDVRVILLHRLFGHRSEVGRDSRLRTACSTAVMLACSSPVFWPFAAGLFIERLPARGWHQQQIVPVHHRLCPFKLCQLSR